MIAADPLITIGITCFNEGDWLRVCWDSVLAQSDDRWVAVMVLDGGHDARTREIFEQLEHPKLNKFVMPNNAGPYPTRNKAFELTRTPYHFYLDGDDALMPNSVALSLETFAQHSDAGFVYGDYKCFGGNDEIRHFLHHVMADDLVEVQQTPGACAYKKDTWTRLGGFADALTRGNADYDFLIGAFEAGIKGYHCGEPFYRYRSRDGTNVSSSYNQRYHETHEIMVCRHPKFFSDLTRRRRFLALGYRRAALANQSAGRTKTAARLAWAACRHGMWREPQMLGVVLEGTLPLWLYRMLREAWRFGRALPGTRPGRGMFL